MNGQPTKAAAAYVFGRSQETAWPIQHILAYQLDDGLWYATTRWSPDGVMLASVGTDERGRRAIRIERLDEECQIHSD